jgi:membrane associated rhomboid family serine protease
MILILPLARQTPLAKVPYFTIALIAITFAIHFLVWPQQKEYLKARLPETPYQRAARALADFAAKPETSLSDTLTENFAKESKSPLFPSASAEALIEKAHSEIQNKPYEIKSAWQKLHDHYNDVKVELEKRRVPEESFFDRYGFDPSKGLMPGLLSHMFLHAGFLHLFFNMFLLWIVGAGIEERWGPLAFIGIYFTGGMAAALAQEMQRSVTGIGLVGASGAVAAIMGAFLIRHYRMPIRVFYLIFSVIYFKTGIASWPAWTLLIMWLLEQIVYAMLSDPRMGGGVAYGAHIGGFIYGAAVGWFVLKGGIAAGWEKEAANTQKGMAWRYVTPKFANGFKTATGRRP